MQFKIREQAKWFLTSAPLEYSLLLSHIFSFKGERSIHCDRGVIRGFCKIVTYCSCMCVQTIFCNLNASVKAQVLYRWVCAQNFAPWASISLWIRFLQPVYLSVFVCCFSRFADVQLNFFVFGDLTLQMYTYIMDSVEFAFQNIWLFKICSDSCLARFITRVF